MRRPAMSLLILLVLAGHNYALAHSHAEFESWRDAADCLVCHSGANIDHGDIESSPRPPPEREAPAPFPVEPDRSGREHGRPANARAPPSNQPFSE